MFDLNDPQVSWYAGMLVGVGIGFVVGLIICFKGLERPK